MRNVTTKSSLYLLVGISTIAWFFLSYFRNLNLSEIKDFIDLIPKVISIVLLIIAVFFKWGWLVPFPNLNWSCVDLIYSDCKNPNTAAKPNPIPVMLTVNQSLFQLGCKMYTREINSSSYSDGFPIYLDQQINNRG